MLKIYNLFYGKLAKVYFFHVDCIYYLIIWIIHDSIILSEMNLE